MKALNLVLAMLIYSGWVVSNLAAQVPGSQALDVLKNYEGNWETEFSIVPQSLAAEPTNFTGRVEGKWSVGGKFLEQTGTYLLTENATPLVIKTMMSFDETQERYQYDYFTSSGDVTRSFGKWDEASKTMTSTMTEEGDGKVTTIVADFSQPGIEKWTIETKNAEGKSTAKIVGTNTRQIE